jgi:hypothetical protein
MLPSCMLHGSLQVHETCNKLDSSGCPDSRVAVQRAIWLVDRRMIGEKHCWVSHC